MGLGFRRLLLNVSKSGFSLGDAGMVLAAIIALAVVAALVLAR